MDRRIANAHLGLLLRAAILGVSFNAVDQTSTGLPPLLLTALRFAIAAMALLPFLKRGEGRHPPRRAVLLYAMLGACQAGFFGAMFWSAHRTSPLMMASLYAGVPLLTYGLGLAAGVEKRSLALPAILSLGAAGALCLAFAQAHHRSAEVHAGAADSVFVAGCIALSLYAVLTRWGLNTRLLPTDAIARTLWSLLAGGVLVGLVGLVAEEPQALTHLNGRDVLLLFYLGVLSTGGTFWLMQRAAATLSPAAASAYSYAPPLVSLLLQIVARPQMPSWGTDFGAAAIVTAMCLLLWRDGRARRAASNAGSADRRRRAPQHAPADLLIEERN